MIFTYDIGRAGYKNSTVRAKVNAPEKYGEILEHNFADWDKVTKSGGKEFFKGLYNRRSDEWKIFKYGDYRL